jgi:hypothetical protein
MTLEDDFKPCFSLTGLSEAAWVGVLQTSNDLFWSLREGGIRNRSKIFKKIVDTKAQI